MVILLRFHKILINLQHEVQFDYYIIVIYARWEYW